MISPASFGELKFPTTEPRVLLHSCCAPCACYIARRIMVNGGNLTILFYNPNIHPAEEYARRKEEILRFAKKHGIPIADLDYDVDLWKNHTRGYEGEPERGSRCFLCFKLRMTRTARYAQVNNFKLFATSLGVSQWKDLEQVNQAGREAAQACPGTTFWDFNWRANRGFEYSVALAKQEKFYRQNYCGCVYSQGQKSSSLTKSPKPLKTNNPEDRTKS